MSSLTPQLTLCFSKAGRFNVTGTLGIDAISPGSESPAVPASSSSSGDAIPSRAKGDAEVRDDLDNKKVLAVQQHQYTVSISQT